MSNNQCMCVNAKVFTAKILPFLFLSALDLGGWQYQEPDRWKEPFMFKLFSATIPKTKQMNSSFCFFTFGAFENQIFEGLTRYSKTTWFVTRLQRFDKLNVWPWPRSSTIFTRPRCPWGPVYGALCLYQIEYNTFLKVCLCDSGWWCGYQLNTISGDTFSHDTM